MSPLTESPGRRVSCFPRVSGDEPVLGRIISSAWEFSPRERG